MGGHEKRRRTAPQRGRRQARSARRRIAQLQDSDASIRPRSALDQSFGAANTPDRRGNEQDPSDPPPARARRRRGLSVMHHAQGSSGNAPKPGGGVRCLVAATDAATIIPSARARVPPIRWIVELAGASLAGPASRTKRGQTVVVVLLLMERSSSGYSDEGRIRRPLPYQAAGRSVTCSTTQAIARSTLCRDHRVFFV